MPDNTCELCKAKIKMRVTHQHGPEYFRSPANPHGGQPGLWHDVVWSEQSSKWTCDARCHGGYGKECRHIKDVLEIMRDEFSGWLGEVPKRTPAPVLAPVVVVSAGPVKRLEDIFPN